MQIRAETLKRAKIYTGITRREQEQVHENKSARKFSILQFFLISGAQCAKICPRENFLVVSVQVSKPQRGILLTVPSEKPSHDLFRKKKIIALLRIPSV